jgi:hypothetical protein
MKRRRANDVAYRPLMRSLRTRHDNLKAAIATLELKAGHPANTVELSRSQGGE